MKRIIALLLPLLSSLCFGQALSYTPPSAAAYISPSPGVWNAWTSAAAFGALGYTPPSVGLYCQASSGAQWTPCIPGGGSATPSGPAGGDLGGTYPNPTVVASHITSGSAGFTGPVTITNTATSGNTLFINTSSLFGSAVSPLVLQGNAASGPGFGFTNTTYGTNNKTWDIYQNPTSFNFRTSDDANSSNVTWLSAVRSGNAITGITSSSGSGSWAHTGSIAATGAVSGNQFAFAGDLTTKLTNAVGPGTLLFQSTGTNAFFWTNNEQRMTSADTLRWVDNNDVASGLVDTSFGKLAAGSFYFGNGAVGDVTAILNGGRFVSSVATGTAPLTVASTTPVANLTVSNHPTVQYCGITAACSATAETNGQIVFGSAVLDGGTPTSQVTITGVSPVFADTAYICTVNSKKNTPTTVVISVNNITTSSFQIVGTALATDTVGYICVH